MPVYATLSDYINYTGSPANFLMPGSVLARASRVVDRALIGAIYETDLDGTAVDTTVADALRDATCAQARGLVECPENMFGPLTVEAYDVLRGAGLLPAHPRMVG